MITVMELQFDSWEHEEFNAGFLNTIKNIVTGPIRFVCSPNHLFNISRIIDLDGLSIHTVNLPDKRKVENRVYLQEYISLVRSIADIIENENDEIVIVLSSPKNVICSVGDVMCGVSRLIFCQHANLDWIISRKSEQEGEYSYAELINHYGKYTNISFIAFNPYASTRLRPMLNDDVLKKLYFVHLPIIRNISFIKDEKYSYIGAYGQSLKGDFSNVLKAFLKEDENWIDSFMVFRGTDIDHLDYSFLVPPNLKIFQKIGGFSREEKYAFLSKMKWILLPYTDNMYEVSMSGILADAIQCRIPILGLSSPILKYYNRFHIGIIKETPLELYKAFLSVDEEVYCSYIENMDKLLELMKTENEDSLAKIIYGAVEGENKFV